MCHPSGPSSLTRVFSLTRKKELTTGKAVFDVEFVLLHQQREMNFLKARMDIQGEKMDKVVSMLERLTKVVFASDVGKLDGDGWF